MAGFNAPIDPAGWTLTLPQPLVLPEGLRYSGLRLPQLRAERPAPAAQVRMPAPGVLRAVTPSSGPDAGRTFVEIQVNPFGTRRTAVGVPFGLPTFYLVFEAGAATVAFSDGDTAPEGEPIAEVEELSILCAGQDRVGRDPALWSRQILAAIPAPERGAWQPFADAVEAQTASGADPPVLVLDHRGAPLETGDVEIESGSTTATARLIASDGGDLQRAVARMHAANPATMPLASVFGAGSSATLRPSPSPTRDFQLARLEDDSAAATEIDVTRDARHVSFTDLWRWFAPQFASPPEPLADYTRDNEFTPLVNGGEYYDDLFRRVHEASLTGAMGGLHLVGGWQTFPDVELTTRREGEPEDLPLTLEQAAALLGASGGVSRFLSPRFIQLDPGSPVEAGELIFFSVVMLGLLRAKNVDFLRSDAGGAIILLALFVINLIAVQWIINTDGRALEPNEDAVEILDAVQNAVSRYSPHPTTVEDNPNSPPLTGFPFDQVFKLIRHFGVYHQKFGVVGAGAERYAYCGGIDINPNRLDDVRHLGRGPYHDVHARVRGAAARDVELSFAERWSRDGGGESLAFEPAAAASLGAPGSDVVQIARTYHKAADPSRELAWARQGDNTIAETMMRAIGQAREFIYIEDQYFTPPLRYRQALLDRVAGGHIHTLIILLPSVSDQPFGEVARSDFIGDLRDADAGRGIVHVGYPRRHYTVADNELRGSSGRMLLMADLQASGGVDPTVALGPKARLPHPPFWFAVEGELMYAYNESTAPNPDPDNALVFEVVRGADTRLVTGGAVTSETPPRSRVHEAGAPATVIDLSGIYVHAKMMIVDDAFVGIGSANVNKRGLYHDGEITAFSVPQRLKAARSNPVAALRRRLWAEMLDLPVGTAGPLLEDPRAAARLFDRSPLLGNRFTEIDAYPTHLMFDASTGDGLALILLRIALVDEFVIPHHQKLFDGIIDPTSALESV